MTQTDVSVRLDDRVRLMSALLAATDYPQKAQERKPHGTHAHARATSKRLRAHKDHDAVKVVQVLLNKNAPLETLYAFAVRLSWPQLETNAMPAWLPPNFPQLMRDFYEQAQLNEWWGKEDYAWQKCLTEAGAMFKVVEFKPFLSKFLGTVGEDLTFVPNIAYPTDQEMGVRIDNELMCIAPPRLAWGDSPPWPFDEDPAHIYRSALTQFGRLLLLPYFNENSDRVKEATKSALPVSDQFKQRYTTWYEQFMTLFLAGVVAIYLEDHVSSREANAYVLMERKTEGMDILPGVISVLRRYLSELENGRYDGLVDFLSVFPKQLRIAKRIVSM